ncbi:hypothetical protein [Brasilonema sp. UFV-L1]|uniref:hypothetical protein n=1 Tax=Brasilonema sp. UFV-L1 TaxID=2234130 RepID=UPI00145D822F|nr:hypothetical protein [Brasilonema sp. UFV-L1]
MDGLSPRRGAIALLLNLDTYDSHPVLHNTQKTLLKPDTITLIAIALQTQFIYVGESPCTAKHSTNFA